MGLAVAKPPADRAVGLGCLGQPGFGIGGWRGKGPLQPLEHGGSVDLDREGASIVSDLPIGVCDMDELIMVVNRRHAPASAVPLVVSGGIGARIEAGAAVVVDVIGNGPRRHVQAIGQLAILGAILGLAGQQQVVAQLLGGDEARIHRHREIADPEGSVGVLARRDEGEAASVGQRPASAAVGAGRHARGFDDVARHVAQKARSAFGSPWPNTDLSKTGKLT